MRKFLGKTITAVMSAVLIMSATGIQLGQNQVYANNNENSQNYGDNNGSVHMESTTMQYVVSQDGTGDFVSIQEAVDIAKHGDTIIVYPGIYNENVEVMGKSLNITGVDKNTCILQCDTISYRQSPLTIAAGSISNLTIYGIDSGVKSQDLTQEEVDAINAQIIGDSWERQKNYSGYAVHVDQNCLYGNEIRFENCKIISENNYCVGMGSRGQCRISFNECEIISLGQGGCIYLHDCTSPEICGNVDFQMKSCKLTSYMSPYVMTVQSLMPLNTTYCTFQNVCVNAVAYQDRSCYDLGNINTGFEIDVLASLDNSDQLEKAGLSSTAMHNLVHEMNLEESREYMHRLEKYSDFKNALLLTTVLPEGITYISATENENPAMASLNILNRSAKRSVLALYNSDGKPGTGWCGLNNVFLTKESCGNTLVEMNAQNNVQNNYN